MSTLSAETPDLLKLLELRSEVSRDQAAFEFSGNRMTFGRLWAEINGFAAFLKKQGLGAGSRVLIAIPNSPEFFPVFYGIQRAGGIPVPIYPDSGPERIKHIANICSAQYIVTTSDDLQIPAALIRLDPDARAQREFMQVSVSPDTIAYIQFTSGSTGDPKGVPITYRCLMTNIRQLIAGMEITPDDVFVSWLPIYHDMGLILMTMVPFYLAARLVLLPTSFVNLRRWLATIAEQRGTFTASPDFGYRLALRYATDPAAYDLKSLRVALNAAEYARPETIRSFEDTFGLKNVMTVGYGLAEATVGVSMTQPGAGVRVDADGFTSVGKPFPQVDIRILAEDGGYAQKGQAGEVLISSPALTSGYYQDPDSKQHLFTADGFLRTGDIGYLDQFGELYIVGRKKEMLKHAGRTLSPREVEAALDNQPDLRQAAAVSLDLGGLAGEQVLIVAELVRPAALDPAARHNLAVDLVARVHAALGIRPARVYLAKPRAIPLSANGKMQRNLLRAQLADGSLRRAGLLLYPDF